MLVQVRVQRVLVASKRCSEDNAVLEILLLAEAVLEGATARAQAVPVVQVARAKLRRHDNVDKRIDARIAHGHEMKGEVEVRHVLLIEDLIEMRT